MARLAAGRGGAKSGALGAILLSIGLLLGPATLPATSSALAIRVGAEHPISSPVYVKALRTQASASMAWNGTEFLVVWEDQRLGNYDIFGSRLAADGTVLDSSGIPITTAPLGQFNPSVAWNGTEFLVVWEDRRQGGDIYGARVGPGGAVLDPDGIPISTASGSQRHPTVAAAGSQFLAVWDDGRGASTDVYGARVSASGGVLDPAGIPISTAAGAQARPDVAYNGSTFLVAWQDSRSGGADVFGSRLGTSGVVQDPAGIPISTAAFGQTTPAVAVLGGRFLVVWDDARSGTGHRIFGARVESNGHVLDPSGLPISSGGSLQTLPDVGSDGTNFLVVWQDTRATDDVYGARVSAGGTVLDSAGIVVGATGDPDREPAVSGRGSGFLVTWQQGSTGSDVVARGVSPDGVPQAGPTLVASAAEDQANPALAWSGTGYLAAWTDQRPDGIGVNVSRIGTDGSILDGTGIVLGSGPEAFSSPTNPAIAAGAVGATKEFLVVWEDRRTGGPTQVWGARVGTDGTVLDPGGFRIFSRGTDALFDPAVAWDGTDFLVTWTEYEFGVGGVSGVFATRVAPDGTVLDPGGIALTASGAPKFGVAAGGNSDGFLVAWSDDRSGGADVFARRVSPGGVVRDATPLPLSEAAGSQTWPAVATNGSDFLVAWQSIDGRQGVSEVDGTPVTANGGVTDPGGTILLPKAGVPAAAWDGSTYLVAAGTSKELLGQRLGPGGGVLDGTGFRIAKEGDQAAAVAGSPKRVAVAYLRVAPERPYGTDSRGFLRFVDEVPDTTAPATALRSGPRGRVASTIARFSFRSNEPGARFRCSLDGRPFSRCSSPRVLRDLAQGRHRFRVVAVDRTGNVDPVPASRSWTVASIRIRMIRFDPPGPDSRSARALNREWVSLHNAAHRNVRMRGWSVADAHGHRYRFGRFSLRPGATVRIHSGKGTNRARDLYWGRTVPLWSRHDRATLRRGNGTVADRCSYSAVRLHRMRC